MCHSGSQLSDGCHLFLLNELILTFLQFLIDLLYFPMILMQLFVRIFLFGNVLGDFYIMRNPVIGVFNR